MRYLRIFVYSILILSIAGCVGQRREPTKLSEIEDGVSLVRLWGSSLGDPNGAVLSPNVSFGRLCAASATVVTCFDVETGREVTSTNVAFNLTGGVGTLDGQIFVGGEDGEVLFADAAGQIQWKSVVDTTIMGVPMLVDGVLVARDVRGKVYGFDSDNGELRWEYQPPNQSLTLRSAPGFAYSDGTVIVGFPGGAVAAINVLDGEIRWSGAVSIPSGDNELERVSDVLGTPTVADDDTVCLGSYQGRVTCFDSRTGTPKWSYRASVVGSLAADDGKIYVSESNGDISALDLSTGSLLWKNETMKYRRITGPSVFGPWVVVGDVEGIISMLNSETGDVIGRRKHDGNAILTDLVVDNDKLIVQDKSGELGVFVLDLSE